MTERGDNAGYPLERGGQDVIDPRNLQTFRGLYAGAGATVARMLTEFQLRLAGALERNGENQGKSGFFRQRWADARQ